MITVDLLRRAGVSDALIVRIVDLEQSEVLATKREQSRIRSQNYRARHPTGRDSVTLVTRDVRDARDAVSGAAGPARGFLKEVKKDTTEEETKVSSSVDSHTKKRRGIETPFPEAWLGKMPDEAMEVALKYNLGPSRANLEWDRFKNRNLARGEKYVDWLAAWAYWLRHPFQKPNDTAPPPTVEDTTPQWLKDKIEETRREHRERKAATANGSGTQEPDYERDLLSPR